MSGWLEQFERIPCLALRKGKLIPRPVQPVGFLIHWTGKGIQSRFDREKTRFGYAGLADCAVRVYKEIMLESGTWVVGSNRVVQLAPTNMETWHAGIKADQRRVYLAGTWGSGPIASRRFQWWFSRWPGLRGPQDLACGLHPNQTMIGIELTPELDAQGYFLESVILNLKLVLAAEAKANRIPLDASHVLTHSDANPLARTTILGKPWDPPAPFFEQLKQVIQ